MPIEPAAAERYLAEWHEQWITPQDRECLTCYLGRMLADFGCDDTLRWAKRWRDLRAPRATALERRLADKGGYCDCEVAMNVCPEQMPSPEDALPKPCAGVSRRGSTKPCRGVVTRRPPPPA
ncbi:MAG TPA: DUF2695 domain-containing protein [Amycolatopsis sp.]|uniref:DUF2695 domain-containing protein n=1 Tax=Amycolatopsis sp. TaxID=37632 RepID=UPI002B488028|nr:DUF2695 domain-containing protein [Amycolatopsis sp.]HKS47124.1 DUF2695 domain-containing protein [Amycolatopsis sp.]